MKIKNLRITSVIAAIAFAVTFGNCKTKTSGDDSTMLLGVLLLSQPKKTLSGTPTDIKSASVASSAVSSAVSSASSAAGVISNDLIKVAAKKIVAAGKASPAATGTISGNFDGTYPCNTGTYTVTNSSMTGDWTDTYVVGATSYTTATNISIAADISFAACQMSYFDYNKLKTGDFTLFMNGDFTQFYSYGQLDGAMKASYTSKGSYDYTGTSTTTSYSSDMKGTHSGSGTSSSTSFSMTDIDQVSGTQTTLLTNSAFDLKSSGKGTINGSLSADMTTNTATLNYVIKGNYAASGTVGGNAVNVNWDYNWSYVYP